MKSKIISTQLVNFRRVKKLQALLKYSSEMLQNMLQVTSIEVAGLKSVKDLEPFTDCTDFESFEHESIGERIELEQGDLQHLKLPNGVEITFGQIIALAGDLYGIPTQPIVDPSKAINQDDSAGRRQRFLAAYNSLASKPKLELQGELNKLITALNKERQTGESNSAEEWDKITGGTWLGGLPIKHGRMLKLAEHNHDHFLPYAKDAYLTGHQLALERARDASKCGGNDGKRLFHEALLLDGFACHFLTDSFASGHIRTPRFELAKETTPAKLGHLLSKCMHDEDGVSGLRVTNARGDKWTAYGDGMLLDERSKDNLKLVTEAVQNSVEQVYKAYYHPGKPLNTAAVTDLIPFVDQEEENSCPLVQVKGGQLHRRAIVGAIHESKTITNWWAVTTVLQTFI